jgi:hypothetical protein
MKKRFLVLVIGIFPLMHIALAQTKSLQVRINNQPFNSVAVGYLHGDQFVLADSVPTSNTMNCQRYGKGS